MSRSYKKTPRAGMRKDRAYKKYANRKLRRNKLDNELQHNAYRKNFMTYDICDYQVVGTSFEEYYASQVRHWHEWMWQYNVPFPDKEKLYREWYKYYKGK
jgi:hypothetical protein